VKLAESSRPLEYEIEWFGDLCESAPPQSHGIQTPHPEIPSLALNYPLSRSCCLS
jgi:hypothetical protein